MTVININELNKLYKSNWILKNINLSVNEYDFYCISGLKLSGKTTLIKTLLGFIKPTSGLVYVLNMDINRYREDILRDTGYISYKNNFWNNMTVDEVIKFSARLKKKDCNIEAKRLCERFRLDRKKRVIDLPRHEQRKIDIVCAMQSSPKLYILDEPSKGLYSDSKRELFKALNEERKRGSTILMTSDNIEDAKKYCNKISIIKDGEILISNSVQNLSKIIGQRVSIKGINTIPPLKGISDPYVFENTITFLYRGNTHDLINYLSRFPIESLNIDEPEIDEIYKKIFGR